MFLNVSQVLRQTILLIILKPTMQNPGNPFETAILHTGINDILKRGYNIDVATNNIINVAKECKNYGIKTIFGSGLTINNRLYSDFIKAVNKTSKLDCTKYGCNFIKNSNLLSDNFWQDDLHLSNSGKGKFIQ